MNEINYSIIKKNLKIDNLTIITSTIIIGVVIFGLVVLFHMIKTQIKTAELIVQEAAQQTAYNAYNKLNGDMQVLQALANNTQNLSPKKLQQILRHDKSQESFSTMGYIPLNGIAQIVTELNYDITYANVSTNPCFQKAKKGKGCFIRLRHPAYEEEVFYNLYFMPIFAGNKVSSVLSAKTRVDILKNIVEVNNFNERAFNYIVKKDGTYLVNPENRTPDYATNIFYDESRFITLSKREVAQKLANLEKGVFWTFNGGEFWINAFTPIGYEDWLVVFFVPAKVLMMSIIDLLTLSLGIIFAINFLLYIIIRQIDALKKKSQQALLKVAFSDEVTGGINKSKFLLDSDNIIQNMRADENYAMLMMDITKFNVIHELYGIENANEILKDLHNIIDKNLPKGSLVARYSSATFSILLKYRYEKQITEIIDNIYKEVDLYNLTAMDNLNEDKSKLAAKLVLLFGVYFIKDTSLVANIICERANLAKRNTTNDYGKYISFYDDKLRMQLLSDKTIEDEMHKALEQEQFVMYLQPKYNMKTLTVVGSEALVRWVHPTRGFIPPNDFIPLFEKNGFVINLDKYVWEQACKTIRSWIDKGVKPVPISVNVSRLHLCNELFVDGVLKLINKYEIPPELIEFELTESACLEDFDRFIEILKQLKKIGFTIAMDDFGAGYSSLNMLRRIPVDILKLDREFLNDTTTSDRGKVVVRHVLAMAKNLKVKTVAEGIETIDQANFLTSAGCDIAQGFLYSKPINIVDFENIAFTNYKLSIDGLILNP